tara:strand:- start:106 stop:429 length:324 start_codon:yes stop_codon:yes gene_type:complete
MQGTKVSRIARELEIILERGIDREWAHDPFTAAAYHVCNLQKHFTIEHRGSELLVSRNNKTIATCIWCDLGVSFDSYFQNHPLLYEFLKVTLFTVKELKKESPLQEH